MTFGLAIPQVNRFFFRINDSMFSPEACISSRGFLTADNSFFKFGPLEGSGILSVQEYANAVLTGKPFDGITPIEVADALDESAAQTLEGAEALRARSVQDEETRPKRPTRRITGPSAKGLSK